LLVFANYLSLSKYPGLFNNDYCAYHRFFTWRVAIPHHSWKLPSFWDLFCWQWFPFLFPYLHTGKYVTFLRQLCIYDSRFNTISFWINICIVSTAWFTLPYIMPLMK